MDGHYTCKAFLKYALDKQARINLALAATALHKACLLKDLKNSVVETKPKKPFITSTLLEKASSMLGLSISEVQSLAQSLFEAGLITYIRTDAESLSVEFLNEAESFYLPIYKEVYQKRESLVLKKSISFSSK